MNIINHIVYKKLVDFGFNASLFIDDLENLLEEIEFEKITKEDIPRLKRRLKLLKQKEIEFKEAMNAITVV